MTTKAGRRVPSPVITADQLPSPVSIPKMARKWPALWKFFQEKRRKTNIRANGCLTLFFEDGRFKLCVNDRANQRSLFVSGSEVAEVFDLANRALESDKVGWRAHSGR